MAGAPAAPPSEATALRAPIAASWQRSLAAGVDPLVDIVAPLVADVDEVTARWEVHPLSAVVPLIREYVGEMADDAQGIIVVTDAQGTVLWVNGDPHVRFEAAKQINLTEGESWSESGAGTNAIGTGLAAQHAVQVFGAEHFNVVMRAWTCAAAPVRDPDSGDIIGIVDLTARPSTAHPYTFVSSVATAGAVETHLYSAMLERHARLRSRYEERIRRGGRHMLVSNTGRILSSHPDDWVSVARLSLPPEGGELVLPSGARAFAEPVGHAEGYIVHADEAGRAQPQPVLRLRLLGEDPPLVEFGGKAVRLSPRHAEVLGLLLSRRAGMTSEELAADLYGDQGQPGAARVEASRLRKLLGGAIDADAYRLTIPIESDVARVRALLDRGKIREAVEQYEGPLLPRSEAPGIVRERDELEAWVRQAVMSADDRETLWAWVQCPSGRDDLHAWKRLLTQLEFRDPRRTLAAARAQSLRTAFATA